MHIKNNPVFSFSALIYL